MVRAPPPQKSWLQSLPVKLAAVGSCVVAIGTIIGAIWPALDFVSDHFKAKGCESRPGYPRGKWSSHVGTHATAATYSDFIVFVQPQRGTWLGAGSQGTFFASNPPTPNGEVMLTFQLDDNNSPYRSTNKLVVSEDGCQMAGTFGDTEGHFGDVTHVYEISAKQSK